jgi:TonB-dependent starch-binding outer membrane protein SusC
MKRNHSSGRAKLLPLLLFSTLFCTVAFAQKIIVGKVVSANENQPIAGATIAAKQSQQATTTGADGAFSLTVPNETKTLVISFIGYDNVEVDVTKATTVNVSLKLKAGSLNEVVVTGYNAQRKKDIIGAVAVVNIADLKSTPAANLGAQLQGRATGVTVSGTGAPGSPAVVRIRGFQSYGNNEPLYIIDGVPTSDPSILNPQDVESMQVLKDGTASAIYGTRAANGVIIVTTKQGRSGRAQVSYETYVGNQTVTKSMIPKMLNNQEYIEYLKRTNVASHPVFGNSSGFSVPDYIIVSSAFKGGVGAADPKADATLYNLSPLYQILKTTPQGTDWFDAILQKGIMQSHQITASGGNDKGNYSIGLNYFDQQGIIKKTGYKRYSVRANSTFKATNWLRFGENLQVSYQQNNGGNQRGEGSPWSWAYRMVPYVPVYDIKGGYGGNGVGQSGNGSNPIANLYRDQDDKNLTTRLFGNVFAEVQPIKWLTFKTSIGTDIANIFNKDISRKTYERSENQGTTQLNETTTNFINWTWTNTATFQKTFGSDHDVKVLIGTEAIKRYGKQINAFGQKFDLDNADFISLSNAGTASGDRNVSQDFESTTTILSQFGRLDYAFRNKYLVNGTIRRDGSSVFGEKFRYGIFPSVGFGWRLSEERFMKGISWLSDFKIRGGYGTVGSIANVDPINAFTTFATGPGFGNYDLSGSNTSALLGYRLSHVGNPDTKWETTVSKNIGFDLSVLDGRWTFDFNLFKNDTKDLVIRRLGIPNLPIATQPFDNIGTMRNTGFELSVQNKGKVTRGLNYDVQVNFSTYKNKIIKMNKEGAPIFYGMDRFSNAIKIDKGLPLSTFWGYQLDGFYNNQGDVDKGVKLNGQPGKIGTWKYKDLNGDGNITTADAGVIGNPHPKFQMGFNLGLDYKQFDFSAFLFWNYGNDIYNYTKWYTDMRGFVGGVSSRVLYDTWTPSNTNAKLPVLQSGQDGFNVPGSYVTGQSNSYYIEKGSYLRAKTIQLGYTLPGSLLNKIKLSKVRVYVQAQNLFTVTKYSGADPDLSIQRGQFNGDGSSRGDASIGIDQSGFPNPKQLLFGLSIGF